MKVALVNPGPGVTCVLTTAARRSSGASIFVEHIFLACREVRTVLRLKLCDSVKADRKSAILGRCAPSSTTAEKLSLAIFQTVSSKR
jgi:hypothetical protein